MGLLADAHAHACVFYHDSGELFEAIATFALGAKDQGVLGVFVHATEDAEDIWQTLHRASPAVDWDGLREAQDFLAVSHRQAFIGKDGRLDVAHADRAVASLQDQARASGRRTVALFVDASRWYLSTGRAAEWFAFESALGPRLHRAVGLVCAYRAEDVVAAPLHAQVLRTHAYVVAPPAQSQASHRTPARG